MRKLVAQTAITLLALVTSTLLILVSSAAITAHAFEIPFFNGAIDSYVGEIVEERVEEVLKDAEVEKDLRTLVEEAAQAAKLAQAAAKRATEAAERATEALESAKALEAAVIKAAEEEALLIAKEASRSRLDKLKGFFGDF